jgi:hypothetical protein
MHFIAHLSTLAFVAASCATAPTTVPPVVAHPAGNESWIIDDERIHVGTTRSVVLFLLGQPDLRLGDDCWVFWDFCTRPATANPHGFDTLVLSFSDNGVSGMKLVDGEEIRRIASRQSIHAKR